MASAIRRVTWALLIGYGARTAMEAAHARHRQLQGLPPADIAGVAATAWFLANAGFEAEIRTLELPVGTGWTNLLVLGAIIAMIPRLLRSWNYLPGGLWDSSFTEMP